MKLNEIYLYLIEGVFEQNIDQIPNVHKYSGNIIVGYGGTNHQCIIIRNGYSFQVFRSKIDFKSFPTSNFDSIILQSMTMSLLRSVGVSICYSLEIILIVP